MNDFDKLKELLFGAEREALDSIAERVEKPETRAADVAAILPEAIHQSHTKNSELVEAMTDPVGECLKTAFREDPQTYGDALYPVMGPAIRKSILQALKSFSEQINQAVEQSVSPRGLKWRFQAYRAGIPFSDFVLQKTLLYRIEQVYLISRENGLLIGHVHHAESKIKDSDAVSAMFTAIQDFVKESFSADKDGRLESADMGDFTLWAVHGPHALLVCVIRGLPPRRLRGDLSAILERIHFRYGNAIRNYAGDTASVPGVETELQRCLRFEAAQEREDGKKQIRWPVALLLLGIAGLIVYSLASDWVDSQRLDRLASALDEVPGIYLTDASYDGSRFVLRGMRDPLADDPVAVAAGAGVQGDELDIDMQAFQSLEPAMVERRIRRIMAPFETLDYELSDSTLQVSGEAPGAWREEIERRVMLLDVVESVDFTGVVDADLTRLGLDVAALSGTRLLFVEGTKLGPGEDARLRQLAEEIARLRDRADRFSHTIGLTLTGSTDAVGDGDHNAELARRRADTVFEALRDYGATSFAFRRVAGGPEDAAGTVDLEQRNVVVELELVDGTSP